MSYRLLLLGLTGLLLPGCGEDSSPTSQPGSVQGDAEAPGDPGPDGEGEGEHAPAPPVLGEGEGEGEGEATGPGGSPHGAEGEGEGEGEGRDAPDPADDPRYGAFCETCDQGGACPGGEACLTNRDTDESFCSLDCRDDPCPLGSACLDIGQGQLQCVPTGATCANWAPQGWPSSQGLRCTTDSAPQRCTDLATTCVDDLHGEDGYCTTECAPRQACPVGYGRCVQGLCRADWEQGPEGCGRVNGCDDGCGDDEVCVQDGLPDLVAPFCTRSCDDDAGCPAGQLCRNTALMNSRICLAPPCECLARAEGAQTLLEQAYAAAEVDVCDVGFSRANRTANVPGAINRDPYRLSWYESVWQHAPAAVPWAMELLDGLDRAAGAATPLADAIADASERADGGFPLEGPADAGCDLVDSLVTVWIADGKGDEVDRDAIAAAVDSLSPELACSLARVVAAIVRATEHRESALAAFDDATRRLLFQRGPALGGTLGHPDQPPDVTQPWVQDVMAGRTLLAAPMYQAGWGVAATVEAQDWAAHAAGPGAEVTLSTPLGLFAVRDGQDTQWTTDADRALRGRDLLLTVDLGGDDRYEVPVGANNDWDHGVSVHIDLGGDDSYGFQVEELSDDPMLVDEDRAGRYTPRRDEGIGPFSLSRQARQGSGRLGVGLLWDLGGGADTYASHLLSQGFGAMGVGGLLDDGGADFYHCERACQGGATFGVGVLLDLGEGDDRYWSVSNTQGYGYTRGVGVLYDQGGADEYRLAVAQPREGEGTFLFPNAQLANGGANTSMGQGAGTGRRGDSTGDFIFLSGGLGVLRDAGDGDDSYTADVFGQATGFWFGTGVLADAGGDDQYDGKWYVQGSDAHYALAVFLEDGGNDRYNQRDDVRATATGQGHDYSVGWLIDRGGDDVYTAPGLGLGGGNDNGIGYFIEGGGDDRYEVPDGRTFGGAGIGANEGGRPGRLCLGVFVDAGGLDEYVSIPDEDGQAIGNDRTWRLSDRRPDKKRGEKGGGIDASEGELGIP